jgi:GNAT superfamily N-acetyltransferase
MATRSNHPNYPTPQQMNNILQDKSPTRIIRAIEENMAAFLPVFGKQGDAFLNNPVGLKRSITNIPIALFNSVMDAQLEPEQVGPAIRLILSEAGRRNVPVLWWTGPSTRPIDLGKRLEEHGFEHDDEAPGMAVDLASLYAGMPTIEGLSIQLALEDAAFWEWSRIMALGFEVPTSMELFVNAWHDLLRQADSDSVKAYSGWLGGKPVATCLLFLAAGVAGIYSVATIPEVRRKGIGAWMTHQALLQARSMGFQVGILQSSEMGLNVYRSLGFQEYCKINMYRWPKRANTG